MKKLLSSTLMIAVTMLGLLSVASMVQAEDKGPTIKDIMKQHKPGGLLRKVLGGQASDDEKAELVKLYEALAKAKPKKGDAESWNAKTAAILKAAKAGDSSGLRKATNCAGCHKVHK